jgi:hypothetical protein
MAGVVIGHLDAAGMRRLGNDVLARVKEGLSATAKTRRLPGECTNSPPNSRTLYYSTTRL